MTTILPTSPPLKTLPFPKLPLPGHSLYLRPFVYASESRFGVKVSAQFRFIIFTGPVPDLYINPIKVKVETEYIRAAKGGTGFAKCGGNYGGAFLPTKKARDMGYDQVLWTDALEHKYVQEIGTMNVFFIVGNKALTPDLNQGTILAGVTRDSAITLLEEMGYNVEERKVSIDELVEAYEAGSLTEVFGTGTAATISMIKELQYKDFVMKFDVTKWEVAPELKKRLDDIRQSKVIDKHNWLLKV